MSAGSCRPVGWLLVGRLLVVGWLVLVVGGWVGWLVGRLVGWLVDIGCWLMLVDVGLLVGWLVVVTWLLLVGCC